MNTDANTAPLLLLRILQVPIPPARPPPTKRAPPPFSRFTEEQQLSFQIGASVALWLGLGYNLVAFFSAYTSIKRSRELIQDFHTDFSTRRHLATRLTVWPRFGETATRLIFVFRRRNLPCTSNSSPFLSPAPPLLE